MTDSNERLARETRRRREAEAALRSSQRHHRELLIESKQMRHQVRQLAQKVIRAQEEERKEISRELHDELVQALASVDVQLAALKREASGATKIARHHIARTQRLVRRSVAMVYRFARDLRPTLLDDLGLQAALENHIEAMTTRTGIAVKFKCTGDLAVLPEKVRIVVYRVAQAALANVAQHSGAANASVTVRCRDGGLLLRIRDDGVAFDAPAMLRPRRNQRLGLVGMRERVEMLDGTFDIKSVAGTGTTVSALVPYRTNAALS